MKHILLILIITNFIFSTRTFAQEALTYKTEMDKTKKEGIVSQPPVFEFKGYSRDYELDPITAEMAGEHLFGALIAKKLYLLESKYTYDEPVVPGNPLTKTIIRKPIIYDAVKRIDKQLKRKVKKNEISVETATSILNRVLDISLNIVATDTAIFEEAIVSNSDNSARIELFMKRVNLVY